MLNNQPDTGLDETPPQPRPYDPAAGLAPAPSYEVHISLARQGTCGRWGRAVQTAISRKTSL